MSELHSSKEEVTVDNKFTYPCLMKHKTTKGVWLMAADSQGVLIQAHSATIGSSCVQLNMEDMELYHGSVTLEQD